MSEVETDLQTEVETEAQPEVNVSELQAEVERLRKHTQTLLAEKKAKDEQARLAQQEKERLEQEQARKSGDVEKLEKAWQEKLQTYEQKVQELQAERERDIRQREARELVAELTVDPKKQRLLSAFIEPMTTIRDGEVWYKDANGQPVLTKIELINSIKASGEYDVLIDATRASGTGASGQAGVITKNPNEMSEGERRALKDKLSDEEFRKLFNLP